MDLRKKIIAFAIISLMILPQNCRAIETEIVAWFCFLGGCLVYCYARTSEIDEKFEVAIESADFGTAQELLTQGAHIDESDAAGVTLLHKVAKGGHFGKVKFLVEHGANFTSTDHMMETPWHWASVYHQGKNAAYLRNCEIFNEFGTRIPVNPLNDPEEVPNYWVLAMLKNNVSCMRDIITECLRGGVEHAVAQIEFVLDKAQCLRARDSLQERAWLKFHVVNNAIQKHNTKTGVDIIPYQKPQNNIERKVFFKLSLRLLAKKRMLVNMNIYSV